MDCCNSYAIFTIGLAALVYFGYKHLAKVRLEKMLERWNNTPRDVVILHGFPRGKKIPSASPFILKLETYLKMAKIPYKYDSTDFIGPKGKTPWISINGQHVGDSQLCIDYLSKKFDKNLNGSYSAEKIGISTAVRIMLEEHVFWGIRRWFFVVGGAVLKDKSDKYFNPPSFTMKLFFIWYWRKIVNDTWAQGLSRHTEPEIDDLINRDMTAVADILGDKKFLLGDEPCEADACVFGFMAGFVWDAAQHSPYGELIKNKYPNVLAYCERMKSKFWPDWEQCIEP